MRWQRLVFLVFAYVVVDLADPFPGAFEFEAEESVEAVHAARSGAPNRADADRRAIVHGPDEIDLVNSGLEETMIGAHQQIRDLACRDPRIGDLRTAAFLTALTKVTTS